MPLSINTLLPDAGHEYFRRTLERLTWSAGQTQSFDFNSNTAYMKMSCRLDVNYDTAASVSLNTFGFYNLIQRLNIRCDSNRIIKQLNPASLNLTTLMASGNLPDSSIDVTPSQSNVDGYITFDIYFVMPNVIRSTDFILNGKDFKQMIFEIIFGSASDIGTGITINSATLTTSTQEVVDWAEKDGSPKAAGSFVETFEKFEVTATSSSLKYRLNTGREYGRLMLVALADNVSSDSIINNIRIMSSGVSFVELPANMIKSENKTVYRLRDTVAGVYIIDFMPKGHVTDRINTNNFSDFTLELDVTKTGTLCEVMVLSHIAELVNNREIQKLVSNN